MAKLSLWVVVPYLLLPKPPVLILFGFPLSRLGFLLLSRPLPPLFWPLLSLRLPLSAASLDSVFVVSTTGSAAAAAGAGTSGVSSVAILTVVCDLGMASAMLERWSGRRDGVDTIKFILPCH